MFDKFQTSKNATVTLFQVKIALKKYPTNNILNKSRIFRSVLSRNMAVNNQSSLKLRPLDCNLDVYFPF